MNGEDGRNQPKNKIIEVFSDFMLRISKFEELVSAGSRFLVGFHQALGESLCFEELVYIIRICKTRVPGSRQGFLAQPSISRTSPLVEQIIKAHGSRRILSYAEAGCVNAHDSIQNVSKLHTCHLGLQDHVSKAESVVNELECFLDVAASVVQTAKKEDEDVPLDSFITSNTDEEVQSDLSKPEVTDYATMMAVVYSMLKQDYMMQVRIVSSLSLKSSSGELDTYCQMWSLRPFIDDEIMRKAWSLVP